MKYLKKGILVGVAALLLLSVAIINKYPLVTQDSAAYLNMAYAWFFPSDRPAFYGIFIKVVSLTKSIWWPIIGQAILLAYLMIGLVKKLLPNNEKYLPLVYVGLMVLLTPVTWIVSQITADIFTATSILAALLFVLESRTWKSVLYLFLCYYSLLTHNSNTLSMLCFSSLFIVFTLIWKRQLLRSALVLMGLAIFSFLTLCVANRVTNDEFTFSKQGHVFFMGKMVESGMLKTFLDEHCATEHYVLCNYKDSLPPYAADFIWQEGKAFHKTGGWHASKPEYSRIIRSTFTEFKYLKMHISESVTGTIKQLGLTYVGDLLYPFTEGTHPYNLIQKWLPKSIPYMLAAKQQNNQLSFSWVSAVYAWVLLFSSMGAILLLFTDINPKSKAIIWLVIFFVISNAFVTATFANVIGRLNARVVWVLPFLVCILALQWWQKKRGHN